MLHVVDLRTLLDLHAHSNGPNTDQNVGFVYIETSHHIYFVNNRDLQLFPTSRSVQRRAVALCYAYRTFFNLQSRDRSNVHGESERFDLKHFAFYVLDISFSLHVHNSTHVYTRAGRL